jgi:guanyl-specific ribonuclease Sa
MELHPKQLLGILEKPLELASKFVLSLDVGKPLSSSADSQTGHYTPSQSTHSSITSNPLIPACILLLIGFLVLSLSPIRVWLTDADNLPTLAQIFSFSRKKRATSLPGNAENVNVWTMKQSGFYYCQGGTLFGNEPGEMMAQSVALTSGYRPGGGSYCANSQPDAASADAVKASTLVAENQPGPPVPSADVQVWGLKQLGFYYCKGDALFGVKPGRLMRQADALSVGLEPSYQKCSGTTGNVASLDNSSSGTQPSPRPADTSPQSQDTSTLVSGNQAKTSQTGENVNVWVKAEFGFYYCHSDVLYGTRPGQLMSQANALAAGYQPSDGQCSGSKKTQTTAERLLPRVFSRRN